MSNGKQSKKSLGSKRIVGISVALVSALLFALIALADTFGAFGTAVRNFFYGICGLSVYGILVASTLAGIFVALSKRISIPKIQSINFVVMYIMIVLLVHSIPASRIVVSFADYISYCYSPETPVTFGGAIAGIFTWPLHSALNWGAFVFLIAVLILNVYIASDFYVIKKDKTVKHQAVEARPPVSNTNFQQGLSIFTVNPSFEYAPKMQSSKPQQTQSVASILFGQQEQPKEASLYTGGRTNFSAFSQSASAVHSPSNAFEQLYGKLDDSPLPSQSYGADFANMISTTEGKKTYNPIPSSKFINEDVMPPKIMHEEDRQSAPKPEVKPIDITEKENKFLRNKDKSDAIKKLEMLKGTGQIRPLDSKPKKNQQAQAEPAIPSPPAERLEESFFMHTDKQIQQDIEKGGRAQIEVEHKDDIFAPFVNYKNEAEQVSFENENILSKREDENDSKKMISNTSLSSDDELDSLLKSVSTLLNKTNQTLEGTPNEEAQSPYEKYNIDSSDLPKPAKTVLEEKSKIKSVHKYKRYIKPSTDLLERPPIENLRYNEDFDTVARKIEEVLAEFKIEAVAKNYINGPSVTLYEFELARGQSVKRILPLADDIAMRVSSKGGTVRIQAPIMGKDLFGIEVPNSKTKTVYLRSVLESSEFSHAKGPLAFALGPNIQGEYIVPDLANMPHLLIGGATGFGKSVCLNCLIVSLMYRCSPEELRFIFVDPKQVELTMYNGLPHMLLPEVVTEPEKAIKAFDWLVAEMERRFTLFKEIKVGDIGSYNDKINPETTQKLPRIVLVVDELANLMTYNKNEIENKILRLSQKARAAGIHLVLATQRPSKEVITGDIKVNLPCRIALKVTTVNDSRTIFPQGGPEKLAGKGDMLFLTGDLPEPLRLQGAFISKGDVDKVVNFIKENNEAYFDTDVADEILKEKIVKDENSSEGDDIDELFWDALKYCIEKKKASISDIQRRFRMGYNRAGKIIVDMERRKFISEQVDAKPRQVFITMEEYNELFQD